MERLTVDDMFVMEIVVNKFNELLELVEELEGRMNNHMKYHRFLSKRLDKLEGDEKKNENGDPKEVSNGK